MLYWGDSPNVTTGFGTVSKYLLKGLYDTGQFEFDIIGINYFGDFYDRKEYPYQIVPAKFMNPNDPYGSQMLLQTVAQKDYEYVFIMNDTPVVSPLAEKLVEIRDTKATQGKKVPKILYYFPIDFRLLPDTDAILHLADRSACYSLFGQKVVKDATGLDVDHIYLGVDESIFRPLSAEERRVCRKILLGVNSDETFVFINVNRNSFRKDIAKTICAFAEFHKQVPDSLLYIHAAAVDSGAGSTMRINLESVVRQLGLQNVVRFPVNFSTAKGFTGPVLNQLVNCANAYISTHNGEGLGMTAIEAMSAGVSVILPDNTVTPELVGSREERGYSFPCKEWILTDLTGLRPTARIEDVTSKMFECYCARHTEQQVQMRKSAQEFVGCLSWDVCVERWAQIFDEVDAQPREMVKLEGTEL